MKGLTLLYHKNSKHSRFIEALISQEDSSVLRKLLEILKSKENLTDSEAMFKIYGKKNLSAFSRLKFRMRELLLQGIILQLNSNSFADLRTNETMLASRNTLLGKLLVTKELNNLSTELLEKSIVRCIKFNISEDVLLQSRILLTYYSISENYNKYKINKYQEIQSKYLRIYEWEIKSENYYLELQNYQIHSLANLPQPLLNRVKQNCEELKNVQDIDTFRFNYNKFRLLSGLYEYQKNYNAILNIANSFLHEINKQPSISATIIASVNVRQLWALIQAGKGAETINYGNICMAKQKEGSMAWFRLGYYVLKANLYLKKYNDAVELIGKIMSQPNFKKLNEYYTELFKLPLGYLQLIFESNVGFTDNINKSHLPEFKIGKFLNETPVYSKDKRGFNISILLMHIGFLLLRKDYNAIIDRTDSLNQYAYRYLRKDDSFRSNCMIKMVLQMSRADFHPVRTERYTKELLKQLSSVSLAGSGENIEIEVIPFEELWQIMLRSL